ncbi:glutaredoxin family protein [Janthinobacterium aquaticum]|uniref:glutaredoxin family protein n=1 Tax=Janthinobacterium sp. FT58W TaxID=2654254 RepID=UPI0012640B78|nr:glutaredoxin family protein [Janthinobacterium sp. FT58W]KAB8045295.1 glutaredoxin family protein [Janthinobacterium sp. FT58W]
MHFTLYSRGYCHLCQEMFDALQRLQTPAQPFTVEVIDIDQSPDATLLARFDELVPVLFAGLEQPELCHYFLDEAAVRRCLAAQ